MATNVNSVGEKDKIRLMILDGYSCEPGEVTGDAAYYDADGVVVAVLEAGVITYSRASSVPPLIHTYSADPKCLPLLKLPNKSKEPFYAALYKKKKREKL
jgi:hypothetical protein